MKKITCLFLMSCLAAACSSEQSVDMTYNCDPPGASIVEQGGSQLGICPVTVQYHPNKAQTQQGIFYTRKITAVWPDGAVASVPSLTVDITSDRIASYTFVRTTDMQAVAPPPMSMPEPAPAAAPQLAPAEAIPPVDTAGTVSMDYGGGPPAAPETQPMPTGEAPPTADPDQDKTASAHQDQDWFDSFNRKVDCGIFDTIGSVNSGCPPQ